MKMLLFSDVHCSEPAVRRLLALAQYADVIVGAGDFGTMRRGVAETMAPFRLIDRPIILVPGNAESIEQLQDAVPWAHAHNLHGGGVDVNGVSFFGFGGGVPVTPFGAWSYDFTEEDAAAGLASCPTDAVLVVHSPPHGAVDLTSRGQHMGSTSIRETVIRCKPRLVVCGHIHESADRDELLNSTPVVNAGPQGVLWDLDLRKRFVPVL